MKSRTRGRVSQDDQLHAPFGDGCPHKENDKCTHDSSDQPRTLTGRVPSESLSEIARYDRSHNA